MPPMTICSVVNFYLLSVSFFATFCQYLSPSIFLSISQFRLQFSPIPPLGQLSKWAFTLRCLFPSILLPPSAAQIRKIRKYTNTQIPKYPKTQERKYCRRRLSRSAVSTYSQTALLPYKLYLLAI